MKLLKRLLLIVLASALSLGIIAFAAGCDKDPKVENVDYTITVTCEDSSVLSAVKVRLTKNGTNAAEAKALTNGKATFNLAPDSYTVELDGVGEGYTYTKGSVSATKLNETIAISKDKPVPVEPETVTYTVNVTCENKEALANVQVKLMKGTKEVEKKALTNGKATFDVAEDTYTVMLEGLPETCDYTAGTFDSNRTMSITVTYTAPEPETVTYTVNVTCDNEEALEGVQVKLMKGTEEVETKALVNGVVTFDVAEDTYTVELVGLPETCSYTAGTFDSNRTMTITVTYTAPEPEEVDYTVTVTCSEESVDLSNVVVKLMKDDSEIARGTLENGTATIRALPDDYTVELEDLPEFCSYETGSVTSETTSITITVTYTAPEQNETPEEFRGTWTGSDTYGDEITLEITENAVKYYENDDEIETANVSFEDTLLTLTVKYESGDVSLMFDLWNNTLTIYKMGSEIGSLTREGDTPPVAEVHLPTAMSGEWVLSDGEDKLTIDGDTVKWDKSGTETTGTLISCTDTGFFADGTISFDGVEYSFSYFYPMPENNAADTLSFTAGDTTYEFERPAKNDPLPETLAGTYVNDEAGKITIEDHEITFKHIVSGRTTTYKGTIVSYDDSTGVFKAELFEEGYEQYKLNYSFTYDQAQGTITRNDEVFTKENSEVDPPVDPVDPSLELPDSLKGEYASEDNGSLYFEGANVTWNYHDPSTGWSITLKGRITEYDDGDLTVEYEEDEIYYYYYDEIEDSILDEDGNLYEKKEEVAFPTLEGTWATKDGSFKVVFTDSQVTVTDEEGNTYTAEYTKFSWREDTGTFDVRWVNPDDGLEWHINYSSATGEARVSLLNGTDTTIEKSVRTVKKQEG